MNLAPDAAGTTGVGAKLAAESVTAAAAGRSAMHAIEKRRCRAMPMLLASAVAAAANAAGAGLQLDPTQACAYLDDRDLRTRGYRANGAVHECHSHRRPLVGGDVDHSIRYVARGDAAAVNEIALELQVNSLSGAQRAHRVLADDAGVLMKAALGAALPPDIDAAILGAVRGQWQVQGATVTLDRITSGVPGYELRLQIR